MVKLTVKMGSSDLRLTWATPRQRGEVDVEEGGFTYTAGEFATIASLIGKFSPSAEFTTVSDVLEHVQLVGRLALRCTQLSLHGDWGRKEKFQTSLLESLSNESLARGEHGRTPWIHDTANAAFLELHELQTLDAMNLTRNTGQDEYLRTLCLVWHKKLGRDWARSTSAGVPAGPMVNFVYACAAPVMKRITKEKRRFSKGAVAEAIRKHEPSSDLD